MIRISIVIATFHRVLLLRRAIMSCLRQGGLDPSTIEIIVVDNSAEGSARDLTNDLQQEAQARGTKLRYVHEPRPGISHARNAGLNAAAGELVAFLDDDEAADAHWLATLHTCLQTFIADAVLGPVYPIFELERCSNDAFWTWCNTKDLHLPSGSRIKGGASANCLFVKASCCIGAEPFDPQLGLTGGEDTRFFFKLYHRGGRIVWCADAIVHEHIPAARTTAAAILKRHFRGSQLYVQSFSWTDPPEVLAIAKWMIVGAVQLVFYTFGGLSLWLFDRFRAKKCFVKAAGGLGKMCWFPSITLKGYGTAVGTYGHGRGAGSRTAD